MWHSGILKTVKSNVCYCVEAVNMLVSVLNFSRTKFFRVLNLRKKEEMIQRKLHEPTTISA